MGDHTTRFWHQISPLDNPKGQVSADLVAEFIERVENGDSEDHDRLSRGVIAVVASPLPQWELYVDGAANQRGSGIRVVMISPEHITIEKSLRLDFSATNNEVEYEAFITDLDSVKKLKGNPLKSSVIRGW